MTFSQKLDWFWHIVEAVCMAAIVGGIFYALFDTSFEMSAIFGLGFGAGHFHGREKRDCEVKFKIPSPHLKSYWFGLWNKDQLTDFFPVLFCMLGLAYLTLK